MFANRSTGLSTSSRLYTLLVVVVVALVGSAILFPLFNIVLRAFLVDGKLDPTPFLSIFSQEWFPKMVLDTASAVGLAVVCAVSVASIFAWLNERTDANLGWVGHILPLLPLLTPPVALSIGWVFLAIPDVGMLNAAATALIPGLSTNFFNIFSFGGLVFVYTIYFVPIAYVVIAAALQNLDTSIEEASLMNGAGLWRTLRRVSLPAIAPAIAGAALLVCMTGLALYSVPTIIGTRAGYDILSVRTVRSITYGFPPKVSDAVALAVVMLCAIGILWALSFLVSRYGRYSVIGNKSAKGQPPFILGKWRWPVRLLMLSYLLVTSVLPLGALVLVALQPYWSGGLKVNALSLDNYVAVLYTRPITLAALKNSMMLGFVASLVAILFATILARYVYRPGSAPGRGLIDGVVKLPAVLSHLIMGMGFLIAFAGPPFHLGGTLILLLLAYVIVNMPQASVIAGTAAAQVGGAMSEASYMSGAGEWKTLARIALPLMRPGLLRGWAFLFILIAGDVSTSVFLTTARTPVIGVTMLDIWESGTFGYVAALASTFALISAAIVGAILLVAERSRWG